MGRLIRLFIVIGLVLVVAAPLGAKTYHIMLQGFYWNAVTEYPNAWYTTVRNNAQRIADSGFTLVWLPPPGRTSGYCEQGYMPTEYYGTNSDGGFVLLDNYYGTAMNQRDMIWDLGTRGVKAIADMVLNHRNGRTSKADFVNPYWPTGQSILRDDEWDGDKTWNYEGYHEKSDAGRDLDHAQGTVSQGIKNWMAWLKNDVGYFGWRYDMVKGFPAWAVEMYNNHTSPGFSVGEYWDSDVVNNVLAWINGSHSDWRKRATAFDFPLRKALRDAVVNGYYHHLKYADKLAGLIGIWSDKAITFVENHDTEEARNGKYAQPIPNDSRMLQAYAFILTHPGTPSVYWPDIYKMGSSVETALRQMIWARKHYGIHSESPVYIAKAAQGDCYAAYIRGDNGELAIKIGPGAWSPSGSKWHAVNDRITWGTDYCIWGEHGKWWTLW